MKAKRRRAPAPEVLIVRAIDDDALRATLRVVAAEAARALATRCATEADWPPAPTAECLAMLEAAHPGATAEVRKLFGHLWANAVTVAWAGGKLA